MSIDVLTRLHIKEAAELMDKGVPLIPAATMVYGKFRFTDEKVWDRIILELEKIKKQRGESR